MREAYKSMKNYSLLCTVILLVVLLSGCGISHREGGVTIVDMNGYFSGSVVIENSTISTIPVEAAIVQTQTSLYGTLTGSFRGFTEELRITGTLSGFLVTINILEVIGPVTLTGTAEERAITLTGSYVDGETTTVTLFLESDNILPIIREGITF